MRRAVRRINKKAYDNTRHELEPERRHKRTLITLLIAAGALLLFFGALRLLCLDPGFCELFSRTFGRAYSTAAGSVSSLIFPVSLYETFIYCFIAFVIAMLVRTVWRARRREFIRAFSTVLAVLIAALSLVCVYNLTAGFYYNRAEMPMDYRDRSISMLGAISFADGYVAELAALTEKMKFDENTGFVISPYSYAELNAKLAKEYTRLTDGYFSAFTPRVKKIASGWVMSNMHLTGVAFSPFGEANLNSFVPTRSVPVVMAHEAAHVKGVMREDDANLLAYYICLTAEDEFIRYCGFSYTLYNVLNATYVSSDPSHYQRLNALVPSEVKKERSAINEFWNRYTLLDDIADWFNDLYLKFNGTGGTSDYSDPGATITDPPSTPIEEMTVSLSRVQRMIFNLVL